MQRARSPSRTRSPPRVSDRYYAENLGRICTQPSFSWNSRRSASKDRYLLEVEVPLGDGTHIQMGIDFSLNREEKRLWSQSLLKLQRAMENGKQAKQEIETADGYLATAYSPEKRQGYIEYASSRIELREDVLLKILEGWTILLAQH